MLGMFDYCDVPSHAGVLRCMLLVAVLLVSAAVAAEETDDVVVAIVSPNEVVGTYACIGTNPGQAAPYQGTVVMTEMDDGTVSITWDVPGSQVTGKGVITKAGRLAVTFPGGVGTWVLFVDGNLYGIWIPAGASDGGTETWLRSEAAGDVQPSR